MVFCTIHLWDEGCFGPQKFMVLFEILSVNHNYFISYQLCSYQKDCYDHLRHSLFHLFHFREHLMLTYEMNNILVWIFKLFGMLYILVNGEMMSFHDSFLRSFRLVCFIVSWFPLISTQMNQLIMQVNSYHVAFYYSIWGQIVEECSWKADKRSLLEFNQRN